MSTEVTACRPTLRGTTIQFVLTRESAVNTLLLAYVLLTPLLIIPVAGLLGASDMLFVPAIALVLLAGKLRQCVTSHLLMAGFLILVGISLHQTQDFSYVIKWGRLIGITFPFFLAASSTITLKQVIRVFYWSGLLAILLGIVLWWFDVALFAEEANQRLWLESGESRVRAAGLYGNSTAFGSLIAVWTVACGMLAIREKRPNKVLLATLLVVTIIALFSSTSRASLLAIIAGMGAGVSCLLASRMQRSGLRLSGSSVSVWLFSAVVMIASLCWIVPQLIDQEWLNATFLRFDPRAHQNSNGFLAGRVAIWQDYLQSMNHWGLFGIGYKQGHLQFSMSAHNQFLALAAECGTICLGVFLLFVLNIVINALEQLRDKPFESMICLAVMTTFLVDCMGGEPLGSWPVTPITMLLIGICVCRFGQRDRAPVRSVVSQNSLPRRVGSPHARTAS